MSKTKRPTWASRASLRSRKELFRQISHRALALSSKRAVLKATRKVMLAVENVRMRKSDQTQTFDEDDGENTEAYGSHEYWEKRYTESKEISSKFEWFLGFRDIEPLLRNAISFEDRTATFVDLGCGLSMFLRDLRASGYKGHCVGIDYSANAIRTLSARSDCKGIDFKVGDVRSVDDFIKGASVALDKSLMDTMLHSKEESLVEEMLKAVARSLRVGATFISVTQLDPRKDADLAFLKDTILPNLRSKYLSVGSVTVHISGSPLDIGKPAPVVFVYSMVAADSAASADVSIDIIEYESSEDASSERDSSA